METFSAFCNHITYVPRSKPCWIRPICNSTVFSAGHVSTVIGTRPYEIVPREYGKPVAVPASSLWTILAIGLHDRQTIVEGRGGGESYARCINRDGNGKRRSPFRGLRAARLFRVRGLGSIAHSGMKLRLKYAAFDAELKFSVRACG